MGEPRLDDLQFEEAKLAKVRREGETWVITREDGWTMGCDDYDGTPQPGDIARFYGRGWGYPVRGLVIAGKTVFYRTPEEQAEEHRRMVAAMDQEKRDRFEEQRANLDASFERLPLVFQRRIERFRRNNPDFRWEHEDYEMFCCEQAVVLAETLGSKEAIAEFHQASWDEQRERVPGLSDQHSGNTFGKACQLAIFYLDNPVAKDKEVLAQMELH